MTRSFWITSQAFFLGSFELPFLYPVELQCGPILRSSSLFHRDTAFHQPFHNLFSRQTHRLSATPQQPKSYCQNQNNKLLYRTWHMSPEPATTSPLHFSLSASSMQIVFTFTSVLSSHWALSTWLSSSTCSCPASISQPRLTQLESFLLTQLSVAGRQTGRAKSENTTSLSNLTTTWQSSSYASG